MRIAHLFILALIGLTFACSDEKPPDAPTSTDAYKVFLKAPITGAEKVIDVVVPHIFNRIVYEIKEDKGLYFTSLLYTWNDPNGDLRKELLTKINGKWYIDHYELDYRFANPQKKGNVSLVSQEEN